MTEHLEAVFERVAGMLALDRGCEEYANAYSFVENLVCEEKLDERLPGLRAAIDPRAEEAIVWRLLVWRMMRELGNEQLFVSREAGAAKGTFSVHPAIDTLAKTYERLRESMNEITERLGGSAEDRPLGLPDRMKPLLEEVEVVFDELLGPGGFPGRASKNGLQRKGSPGE